MQQAIYTNLNSKTISHKTISGSSIKTSSQAVATARNSRFLRHLALKWDLYGVMTLMASSAAYSMFALAHVV